MRPVESSNLKKVGYDPETRIMRVQFRKGDIYEALDVSPERHEELLAADSKGSYFMTHLRHRYEWTRVE